MRTEEEIRERLAELRRRAQTESFDREAHEEEIEIDVLRWVLGERG